MRSFTSGRWTRRGAAMAVTLLAACGGGFPSRVPTGNWGGPDAGMVVTDTGADLEFDCGAGRIGAPLALDANGDFSLPGQYIREGPGPIPADTSQLAKLAAHFAGHTDGKTMALTMSVDNGSVPTQTYSLVFGGNPHVLKCL